ncbi:sigma 54-interacting transcriptional regulator [Paraneptunicella aestuarii]|uniref:sigma 54-interacting transcriptional regulator n=1 Tax=Paraneptunicella aestuarii TaxID=2831148 RepID=UPI001E454067|nr:sigma 54-interacting transcriptional regulator [Paraneptunicella aestuarii]UAA37903.1 sigma 54-interacting transcriptional regulator [Paraneptunicella aestuarii]
MSHNYAVNKFSYNENRTDSLQHHLNQTIVDSHFKSALIHLDETSLEHALPAEIKLGLYDERSESYITYPILYQKQKLGDLKITNSSGFESEGNGIVPALTHKIALLLKRFQATELIQHYIGKELSLAGYSDALLELEAFIEKASSANCPVIIGGAQGCEKLAVASAIHSNSQLSGKPFIEVNCASANVVTFQRQLIRGLKRAQGGCVFINGIDELSLDQQNVLTELLSSRVKLTGLIDVQANVSNVRLLASTTHSLPLLVEQGRFSRKLFSELNFLSVWIAPLEKRREDIPSIIEKLVSEYHLDDDQSISSEAIDTLQKYHWPENYDELERVIVRLLSLSDSGNIGLAEIEQFAPEVLTEPKNLFEQPGFVPTEKDLKQNTDLLIDILLNKRFEALEGIHPGLQKALKYLSNHYCQEVTLTILSNNAFISPSHLSFLFKSCLAVSFKPLLARMRVERAQEIIRSKPNIRITDVSLEVGFGDLSHFEKIFKRLIGMTPRNFKNLCKNG